MVCGIRTSIFYWQQIMTKSSLLGELISSVSNLLLDQPSPAEERLELDQELPFTPEDWAHYSCPELARRIFKTSRNPHCINIHTITKQARLPLPHFSSKCHGWYWSVNSLTLFHFFLCVWLQSQSLFYLNLLQKELHSLSLDHLTLPILHLAETIANDLLDCRNLSDLYRLR